ncbi:MAG: calcium-binding protein [Thermodesulfobacteriota bacterium]|nr:calcium-binding protein [Thermodesulfobacteriota bacterium]
MQRVKKDASRDHRIHMEIVVDAYNEEERAMGWYYYLEDRLHFPFEARCIRRRHISPLSVGEEMEVAQMAPEDACSHEMFVEVSWQDRIFSVPLDQLEPMTTDEETQQAIEDWHYWVGRGHKF